MRDQALEELLRSLPRGETGPEFFPEVKRRIENRRQRRRRHRLLGSIAALLLLGATVVGVREQRERSATTRRIEEIRAERARIEAELQDLRSTVDRAPGILYLGGTEEVDVVLDLRRLDAASARPVRAVDRGEPGLHPD